LVFWEKERAAKKERRKKRRKRDCSRDVRGGRRTIGESTKRFISTGGSKEIGLRTLRGGKGKKKL